MTHAWCTAMSSLLWHTGTPDIFPPPPSINIWRGTTLSSHDILINKLTRCGLDRKLSGGYAIAYRVMVNGPFPNWLEVTRGVLQGSNIFINDLDQGVHGMLIKFVDDTKLHGIAKLWKTKTKFKMIWIGLNTGLKTTEWNITGINAKYCTSEKENKTHSYKMRDTWFSNITSEKDLEIAIDHKLKCDAATKKKRQMPCPLTLELRCHYFNMQLALPWYDCFCAALAAKCALQCCVSLIKERRTTKDG